MRWQSFTMQLSELSQIAVEKAAESPKTTVLVSAFSTLGGLAKILDWVSGALPTMAILAGFLGALVLAWLNWKRAKLVDVEIENQKINGRMLREAARAKGIEIRLEDMT